MEQAKQVAYTCLRVFFSVLLAEAFATGVGILDMAWGDWKPAITAALAAVAAVVINALNPKDARYGIGAVS